MNRKRCFALFAAVMMIFSQFAIAAFGADSADTQDGIYFSDRDVESYYGGKNNLYFTPLYILNGSRREVAYCYNGTKAWALAAPGKPGFSIEGQHDKDYYLDNKLFFTKIVNPTGRDWADNSESNADVDCVKQVLYAGYPYNAAGIQDKYNLEDSAYRAVTQAAIWKVTSGVSLKAALGDFTYSGFVWTQNMTDAYNEMMEIVPTITPPTNFMMDLYLSQNNSYQNLLSTGLTIEEIKHIGTGVINISKKVTGEEGEMDKHFTFKVELKGADGKEITETFEYSGSKEGTVKSGETISLKSGESVKIVGLPLDADYKVTEVEANSNGYTTTAIGDKGTITQTDKDVSFENHRDEVPEEVTKQEENDNDNQSDKTNQNNDNKQNTEKKSKSRSVETGDNSQLYLFLILMVSSSAGIAVMRRKVM